jgi:hypothetical protein
LAAEVLGQELFNQYKTHTSSKRWVDILIIVESLVVTVLGGELFKTFRTSGSVRVRSDIWLILCSSQQQSTTGKT